MLKKIFLLFFSFPIIIYAHTLTELFEALKKHSQTKSDDIMIEKTHIYQEMTNSKLYPTINLFAKYDNYSSPTGMVPVPPNELMPMVKKPNIAQPFSYNIYREGIAMSMPVFVKSIFTMADKAKAMQKSAKAKKYINLLQNEALIVGSNANYLYLEALKKALSTKERSLLETKKTLKIKVDNGRSPTSSLYKINDGLNQINIAKNNIELQEKKVISTIQSLTGIKLDKPANMQITFKLKSKDIDSLKPLKEKIQADKLNIKAQKEKLYPAVFAHGSYTYSQGEAYNNYKNVDEKYGDVGVTINIPLLTLNQYDDIKAAKLEAKSSEIELQKLTDELRAKAQMLEESLPLLNNSILLYEQSIKEKLKLLKIAKLNYNNKRLSTEEYLRYEDDVVSAKANLHKVKAQKIQTQMQLAVIYANNIEEMVR